MEADSDRIIGVLESLKPQLYRKAFRIGIVRDEIDDVYQDTALHLLLYGDIDWEKNVKGYIAKAFCNECVKYLKSRAQISCDFLVDIPSTGEEEPVESMIRKESFELALNNIEGSMESLRPNDREIILFGYRGMSYREISHAVGTSIDKVKMRLHRARKRLRKAFKGYYDAA